MVNKYQDRQIASLAMRNFLKIEILLYNHQTGKNYKVKIFSLARTYVNRNL